MATVAPAPGPRTHSEAGHRFGRIVDQRWIDASTGDATDRFGYSYDRDGNRLTKDNLVNADFDEAYSYDQLNRLADFERGAHTQAWSLDALGNMCTVTTDGTDEDRSHNAANQITAVGGVGLTYDNNGNTLTDETGRQFVYDAWNRLTAVRDPQGATLETLAYDGAGRKIAAGPAGGTQRVFYYDSQWRIVEEREGGVAVVENVWSPVYVDAMILRDRDADANAANGLEERLYVQQDANWNVTALIDGTSGSATEGEVVERYIEDAYGQFTVLDSEWAALGQPGDATASAYAWVHIHQGGRYDLISGLFNFRNREYSPTLSRWIQQDPSGYGDGMNLYHSFGDNPLTCVDPYGLFDITWRREWTERERNIVGSAMVRVKSRIPIVLAQIHAELAKLKQDPKCYEKVIHNAEHLRAVLAAELAGLNSETDKINLLKADLGPGICGKWNPHWFGPNDVILNINPKLNFFEREEIRQDETILHEFSHEYGTKDFEDKDRKTWWNDAGNIGRLAEIDFKNWQPYHHDKMAAEQGQEVEEE